MKGGCLRVWVCKDWGVQGLLWCARVRVQLLSIIPYAGMLLSEVGDSLVRLMMVS